MNGCAPSARSVATDTRDNNFSCCPWRAVYAVGDMLREQGLPARMIGEDITNAREAAVALLAAFGVESVVTTDE